MSAECTPTSGLRFVGQVSLPAHGHGGFDHGDVHLPTGRVFVAHTANGTVEVIDGEHQTVEQTLPGCPEASGVLAAYGATDFVFAAARGDGTMLVIDPVGCQVIRRVPVGPRPNGLAWDPVRGDVLVADVQTYDASLIDPQTGACLTVFELPGRPRWCVYDGSRERFLVNIREPACVVALSAENLQQVARIDGLPPGPHGLDLDQARNRAFVACDAGSVAVLDLSTDREIARVPIAGEPDAIWYSAAADHLYVAIGDPGAVDVIDGSAFSVVEEISTEEGAHTTAFDSERHRLYVFLPRSCQAAVYLESFAFSQ
jgi:DNA-binding beta-propeller fold protein YncE